MADPQSQPRRVRRFFTRNRKDRPCDGCRKAKVRCVRESKDVCERCALHDRTCTFTIGSIPRNTKPKSVALQMEPILNVNGVATEASPMPMPVQQLQTSAQSPQLAQLIVAAQNTGVHNGQNVKAQSPNHNGQTQVPVQVPVPVPVQVQAEIRNKSVSSASPGKAPSPSQIPATVFSPAMETPGGSMETALSKSFASSDTSANLDLDFSVYLNQEHPDQFLSMSETYYAVLVETPFMGRCFESCHFVAGQRFPLSDTQFLRPVCRETAFIMTEDPDFDDEGLRQEVGRHNIDRLFALYFAFVHPSYPIIHKESFFWKHHNKRLNAALIGAILCLASNWWNYDAMLAQSKRPDMSLLLEKTTQAYKRLLEKPRLSTIQTGLLLLHCGTRSQADEWISVSQLVAASQTIGLNLDCTNWTVPSWEIPPRRRVAWAVFIEDRWSAAFHSLPGKINNRDWFVPLLDADDFEDASSSALVTELVKLTVIMSDILDLFYSLDHRRRHPWRPGSGTEMAMPMREQLQTWFDQLPPMIRDGTAAPAAASPHRSLYVFGYVLALFHAAQCKLGRAVLSSFSPQEALGDDQRRWRAWALQNLTRAVQFVQSLNTTALEAFWLRHASSCLADIGSFIAFLQATALSPEEHMQLQSLRESYQWHLQVSSRASWVFEESLLKLEGTIWKLADLVVQTRMR